MNYSRRDFLKASAAVALAAQVPVPDVLAQVAGERPKGAEGVTVLNPRDRAPVSLIIDDSTCLVNLAHFCIPQFAEVFPDRYRQRWQELPREIPDAFVREFGEWCAEQGVRGKYSIVPYPACVGWVDRDIPGWSKRALDESLKLVRDLMLPNWDIHPEMVTHTWVIDTKTGRPYPERTDRFMENWRWTDGKSVDELADYLSYALRILRNVELPCEGITTPGGFGNRVLPEISQATLQSCRDVFKAEIPHYFRHLYTDQRSVAPRVEYAAGLDTSDPRCCVSIIGCTGDWFGGWDGLERGSVDQFITEDLRGGRLPEVIARGEPAIMVCHWPGIYFNGEKVGFNIFKEIVRRLRAGYDNLIWMKLSEIARYWAAKELTRIESVSGRLRLHAPFGAPLFTIKTKGRAGAVPTVISEGDRKPFREVTRRQAIERNTWMRNKDETVTVCFDLPKGMVEVEV
ncbi:MAG: twin-arginine translocation signal domain-containing protein [Verrucomicrobia subdivision 3 bacterium]|nr:twin-arginine translocation signal domain-containing protein [Limisphaerales bacterium]